MLNSDDEKLDAESWYLNGRHHGRVAAYVEAVRSYTLALQLDPSHVKAQLARGMALQQLGHHMEAMNDFTDVIGRFDSWPGTYLAYYNRAVSLDAIGKSEDAVADCTASLGRNRNQPNALYLRGTVLKKQGKIAQAIGDMDAVLTAGHSYYEAYFVRGSLLYELGRWGNAIRDLDAFLDSAPTQNAFAWQCYMLRGIAANELGDNEAAISDLTSASELSPENGAIYLRRSEAYRAMGEFSKAQDDFNKGRSLMDSSGAGAST